MKTKLFLAILLVAGIGMSACKKKDKASDEKAILSFTVNGDKVNKRLCSGDCGTLISGIVCKTAGTLLTPTIDVSPNAKINPPTGEPKDFSSDVIYTVTAEDGSSTTYTVSITKSGATCP
jgi:hypothetical protein